MTEAEEARRDELAESLAGLRDRMAAACTAVGRDPAEVRLVAVTKTFPATDVALLADLGLVDFGENRDAEAAGKVAEFSALRPEAAARWHMVGRLQRNKARSVARWAHEVQSVDSDRLADALDQAARRALDQGDRTEPMDVLLQTSIDGDPARGGVPLDELEKLAERVAGMATLRLRGVMAVAPMDWRPAEAFDRLAAAAADLRAVYPQAVEVSAGMTGDLEEAIGCGSTCVRVGTALLGGRRLASP